MDQQLRVGSSVDGTCTVMTLFIGMLHATLPVETREKKIRTTPNFPPKDFYDFIIVGAGSAGSVVASRLSENPSWNILLLEAGCEEVFMNDLPMFGLAFNFDCMWNYTLEANPRLIGEYRDEAFGGNSIHIGKILGGTSTINGMVYNRGYPKDYDKWANIVGDPSWDFQHVLPEFKKSENMTDSLLAQDTLFHSTKGLLGVSIPNRTSDPIYDIMIGAFEELGYPEVDQNAGQIGGSVRQFTVRNGRRVSTNRAFLEPARTRPNLHVKTHSYATKVIFNQLTRRAVGVQYIDSDGISRIVHANKEVIVSAGALGSPRLLLLSGIGPAEDLNPLGIPLVKNLPVGRGLRDHLQFGSYRFNVPNKTPSLSTVIEKWTEYLASSTGPFSYPATIVQLMESFNNSSFPDVEHLFRRLYHDDSCPSGVPDNIFHNGLGASVIVFHPKSVGYIRLRNADPMSKPIIDLNYLAHPDDIEMAKRGLRSIARLQDSQVLRDNGITMDLSPHPGCEQHFTQNSSNQTDEYLECVIRSSVTTGYHYVGSCTMGPLGSEFGVVDTKLKVHGIHGLRVVDTSVVPVTVSGHTNAVAIMVAEKASDIIKSAWSANHDVSNDSILKIEQFSDVPVLISV